MCNRVHEEHTVPKRKTGKGWKLFSKTCNELYSLVRKESYIIDDKKWIHWNPLKALYGAKGFCFFFTKKEAERVLSAWGDGVKVVTLMKRISYKGVICRQQETNFIPNHSFDTGLCKSFKIEEEEGSES